MASASALRMRAVASPSALRMACCFTASALLTIAAFSPSESRRCFSFSPSEARMVARLLRSACICFSMALSTLSGGVISCNSTRFTLIPHLLVASSNTARNLVLMVSREVKVWSSSISPMMLRRVVCVSFSMALGRLLISYTLLKGSTIWKYNRALICIWILSFVITFCRSKSYTCSRRSIVLVYIYLPLRIATISLARSINGIMMLIPGLRVA